MKLSELSYQQLVELIDNAKNSGTMSDLLREVMADFYKKPKERVTLTDLVAFGWDVANEFVKRIG